MAPAFRIAIACGSAATVLWSSAAHAQLCVPMSLAMASRPVAQPIVQPIVQQVQPTAPAPAAEPDATKEAPKAPSLAELIKKLDAAEVSAREAAQLRIATMPLTQKQLEEALVDPALTPEQRVRLEQLGPRTLARTSRGAVGARFERDECRIAALIEGFDSCRVLQVGDEIIEFGGTPVTDFDNELRPAIIRFGPGTEVPVRLIREGRSMTVRLKMGEFAALDNGWRGATSEDFRRAWQFRLGDLAKQRGVTAIEPGVDAAGWGRATELASGLRPNPTTLVWGDPTIVAGGEAREGENLLVRNRALTLSGLARDAREAELEADRVRLRELNRQLEAKGIDPAKKVEVQKERDEVADRVTNGTRRK